MPDFNLSDAWFNDSRWVEELTVQRKGEATNESGYADVPDTTQETVRAVVRPARARFWKQVTEGIATSGAYLMVTRDTASVAGGDQILGFQGHDYKVRDSETDHLDGFTIFELEEVTE